MSPVHVVILAAGKGTRMRSATPKVLHQLSGLPMIDYALRAAATLEPGSITVVVGHEADQVRAHLQHHPQVQTVRQEPQLGTGHALLQAETVLADRQGVVVLLSGDVPLLTGHTLRALLDAHESAGAAASLVTAILERSYGYGRIVRRGGEIVRVVEERDASPTERDIKEINAGIYAFDLPPLFEALRGIGAANAQGEYYLPDLVGIYRRRNLPVATWTVPNPGEIRGINSRSELAEVNRMVRQQKNEELMAAGVTLVDPATTYVDVDVLVGPDTVIHPGVHLEGSTRIGGACELHAGVRIVNSTIGDRVTVLNHSVIVDSTIAAACSVGPFAHLRPGSTMGEGAKVGNFVELKKATLGAGAKASHLSYLGDATVGEHTNIGAGTITCNYDGVSKHQTIIGKHAFIGSDASLIAPVTIGDDAYIAAGSAITSDVPAGALAVARARQENKEGWVGRRKAERGGQ
ncbi:MAG: bifunctional UDP-N-acetylglucosamine diphosphorylase/glucosamine-1-phosphate N-acetyltransferase GlmU [Acidobacteriota bacterium]|nr:bifunctional UDP-N-acetylglucosamine diphosphorylase/glucosamine-1-phosphate N-acetyltransferase GlmU [Acidobacteriota bacterium]